MIAPEIKTAKMGFPAVEMVSTGFKIRPKRLSLASASSTLDDPIKLLIAAKRVAEKIPIDTSPGIKSIYCM